MSPKRASAATLAAAALVAAFGAGLAGPAAAWPFGRSERPAAAAADPSAAPAHAAAAPAAQAEAPPQPAGPVERAQADRLDPLARSVFWTREHQVAPNDTVATLSLSRALRDLGQYDQAVAAASEVLVIEPGSVEARLEIGRAHIARGQAFYAVEPLEQAQAAQANDWRILSLLGVAYEQVQRTEDARQAWTQALAL
ncbi:MAG TPA: pilus assembly protein TadD, partial [Caulobacteraceae bacterium]